MQIAGSQPGHVLQVAPHIRIRHVKRAVSVVAQHGVVHVAQAVASGRHDPAAKNGHRLVQAVADAFPARNQMRVLDPPTVRPPCRNAADFHRCHRWTQNPHLQSPAARYTSVSGACGSSPCRSWAGAPARQLIASRRAGNRPGRTSLDRRVFFRKPRRKREPTGAVDKRGFSPPASAALHAESGRFRGNAGRARTVSARRPAVVRQSLSR